MLPRKNRVSTKVVEEIFKKGSFVNSPTLTFKFIKTNRPSPPAISFIAPKSVAKAPVQRNKLRRMGYLAIEEEIKQFPTGLTGVFVFRKQETSKEAIENDIKTILGKI